MKLKVGKYYFNRSGEVVKITGGLSKKETYDFEGMKLKNQTKWGYFSDGSFINRGSATGKNPIRNDLIMEMDIEEKANYKKLEIKTSEW